MTAVADVTTEAAPTNRAAQPTRKRLAAASPATPETKSTAKSG